MYVYHSSINIAICVSIDKLHEKGSQKGDKRWDTKESHVSVLAG